MVIGDGDGEGGVGGGGDADLSVITFPQTAKRQGRCSSQCCDGVSRYSAKR